MIHTFPKNDFKREALILRSLFNEVTYELLQRLGAYVAGGTLTSLFSNRDVNDLDLYFRSWDDMEVFITYMHDENLRNAEHDLTEHTRGWNNYKRAYRRFKKLDGLDLATKPFKVALDTSIRDELDGGGPDTSELDDLITRVKKSDPESFANAMKSLTAFNEAGDEHGMIKNIGMTDKSVMFSNMSAPVMQVVAFNVFETPQDIFDKFDFTINMGAYSFEDETWHFDNNFLKHCAQKVLVVNPNTDYPIISMLRASKYQARGYTISRRETMKLGLAASKARVESWPDAKNHLSGMYGTNVETLFNESRPFSFDLLFDKLDSAGDKIISQIATDKEKGDRASIKNVTLVPVDHFTTLNMLRFHTDRPYVNKLWGVCKSKEFYLLEAENSRQVVHVGMTDQDLKFADKVDLYFDKEDALSRYETHGEKNGGGVLLEIDILNVKNLIQDDYDRAKIKPYTNGLRTVPAPTPSAVIRKYISSNGDFT